MYYTDRTALGNELAANLPAGVTSGAVVVNLKPTADATSAAIASHLRSWVFQLAYEPVQYPGDPHQTLGAVTADGTFTKHPHISDNELYYVAHEFQGWLADAKRTAVQRLHRQRRGHDAVVVRRLLHSKQVVLVADVLTDPMALMAAVVVLQPVRLHGLFAAMGNVTHDVYDALRLQTDACHVRHVLPGHIFADDHYFSGPQIARVLRPKHTIVPLSVTGA